MYDREYDVNYITSANGVKVLYCSSYKQKCHPNHILNNDHKNLWLSEQGVPQKIILDLRNMESKPSSNRFNYFGVYCWHAYQTNPKLIDVYYSNDNKVYTFLGGFELELIGGVQMFKIENTKGNLNDMKYIKLVIKRTYGGRRTYLNQVMFYEHYLHGEDNVNVHNTNKHSSNKKKDNDSDSESIYNKSIIRKKKQFYKIFASSQNTSPNSKFLKRKGITPQIPIKHQNNVNNIETANNQSIPTNNKLYDIISSRLSPKQDFYNINPLLSYTRYKTYASNNSTPRIPNTNIIRSSRSVDYNNCINDDADINDLHAHLNELEKMINHMKIEGGYYFNDEINNNNNINNNATFNNTHQTNSTNHSLMSPASFGVGSNNNNNNKQNEIINEESVDMKLTNIQTDINELKANINKLNENIIQYNNNHTINNTNNNNNINACLTDESFVMKIDENLNQRLNDLSSNIQNEIYNNYIQPSLEQFTNKMKKSMKEVNQQIKELKIRTSMSSHLRKSDYHYMSANENDFSCGSAHHNNNNNNIHNEDDDNNLSYQSDNDHSYIASQSYSNINNTPKQEDEYINKKYAIAEAYVNKLFQKQEYLQNEYKQFLQSTNI